MAAEGQMEKKCLNIKDRSYKFSEYSIATAVTTQSGGVTPEITSRLLINSMINSIGGTDCDVTYVSGILSSIK